MASAFGRSPLTDAPAAESAPVVSSRPTTRLPLTEAARAKLPEYMRNEWNGAGVKLGGDNHGRILSLVQEGNPDAGVFALIFEAGDVHRMTGTGTESVAASPENIGKIRSELVKTTHIFEGCPDPFGGAAPVEYKVQITVETVGRYPTANEWSKIRSQAKSGEKKQKEYSRSKWEAPKASKSK